MLSYQRRACNTNSPGMYRFMQGQPSGTRLSVWTMSLEMLTESRVLTTQLSRTARFGLVLVLIGRFRRSSRSRVRSATSHTGTLIFIALKSGGVGDPGYPKAHLALHAPDFNATSCPGPRSDASGASATQRQQRPGSFRCLPQRPKSQGQTAPRLI